LSPFSHSGGAQPGYGQYGGSQVLTSNPLLEIFRVRQMSVTETVCKKTTYFLPKNETKSSILSGK
jgi:hypothetical protein